MTTEREKAAMKWILDDDGDIGLTFWGVVTFIKYKHSVIVYWFRRFDKPAPKYLAQEYWEIEP